MSRSSKTDATGRGRLAVLDHADHLSRTVDLAVTAIRGTDPARFDEPTPCPEHTVRQLIDHVASALLLARRALAASGRDPSWAATA